MIKQRTIHNSISATGVGLHSGEHVFMRLLPAPPNNGIVFRRIDVDPVVSIPAMAKNVTNTMMSTTLGKDGCTVSTVEHLISALAGMGIDNIYVDLDHSEIPIMDGSAWPFIFLIQSAGIREQNANKKFMCITKTISVQQDDKYASFCPSNRLEISFTINFDHPAFTEEVLSVDINFSTISFVKEICRARTFGFLKDVDKLKRQGLAKGGSIDNSIVLDTTKIVNKEIMRYKNEFVKHKILDAVGDLYLLGGTVIGKYQAYKSGHALNNNLLLKLMEHEDAWEIRTYDSYKDIPIIYSPL